MQSLIKKFNDSKYTQYLLFFIFSFIAFYLIKKHIFFRDDARPILIAISSNSFLDLFNEVRYESNPMLFHLILWLINKITPINVFITKTLFLLINLIIIYLVVFKIQIPNIYRLLILAQVPQIGLLDYIRQYSLAVLLIFAFTYLYIKSKDKDIWLYIILFLLCQSCFHSMICAIGLYVFIIVERYYYRNKLFDKKDLFLFLGVLLCIIQVSQPNDLIHGLKEFKPFISKVNFFFTLHFIYDTMLSNPFSGIIFLFFIYKTWNKLNFQSGCLGYGFIIPIGFILLVFYLICTLKGYSTERHFWMFGYATISLLLITNFEDLKEYLKNKTFLYTIIITIIICIPYSIYTARKNLLSTNSTIKLASYLDKYFPEKLTLHELDFLSDTINVYRKSPQEYYSLNAHRFNLYMKWNHPKTDFTKNKSNFFSIKASELIKDIEKTPKNILDLEPIIILVGDGFLNDLNINLSQKILNNKYKLVHRVDFPGSRSENYFVYQLIRI